MRRELLALLALALALTLVQAPTPTPHGVSGIAYHRWLTNQVGSGTPFRVNDTTNSYVIFDYTGAGPNSGAYSVVIDGNDYDNIMVTAWNITTYGRINISLLGDLDGVNVYLNQSRASELNLTVITPMNNTVYNTSTVFNFTANFSMLGLAGTGCAAVLNRSNTSVITLNGTEAGLHSLGSIALGSSILSTWKLKANTTGSTNIIVTANCTTDREYFDRLNTAVASNLTVVDQISPVVSLMYPSNNSINSTHSPLLFFFNVTDDSYLLNCSLIINGTINDSKSLPSRNTRLNFSRYLANGNYSWSVNCTDSYQNTGASGTYYVYANFSELAITDILLTSPIALEAGSRALVSCNATVTGAITVNATLYSNFSSTPQSAASNSTNYKNSSCSAASGNFYYCLFNLWYYAENATWICIITAKSVPGNITSANASAALQALIAINITPDTVDYGAVPAGYNSSLVTVNITNIGNRPIDLQLYGYGSTVDDGHAMDCNVSFIPIASERYTFNTTGYFNNMTQLSGTQAAPSYLNVSIPKRTAGLTWNATRWMVQVPIGETRNCSGVIVYTAVADG